jgi:hypothetical protein
MRRTLVESEQELARLGRDHGALIILTCKGADRQERIEPHDGDEFYLLAGLPPQQVDSLKPTDSPGYDPGKNLCLEQRFIGAGVLGRGPAPLDAADHGGPME